MPCWLRCRQRAGAADERVVLGNRPVVVDTQHLAEIIARILSAIRPIAIAHREEQRSILGKQDPRPEPPVAEIVALHPRFGYEDVTHVGQPHAIEPTTSDGGRSAFLATLHVRKIDQAVLCEFGMQRDVEQSRQAARMNRRQPGD
jgi:hypothetical protein